MQSIRSPSAAALVAGLFSREALIVFILDGPEGLDIVQHIDRPASSAIQLAADYVSELDRRGQPREALRDRLLDARPEQHARIQASFAAPAPRLPRLSRRALAAGLLLTALAAAPVATVLTQRAAPTQPAADPRAEIQAWRAEWQALQASTASPQARYTAGRALAARWDALYESVAGARRAQLSLLSMRTTLGWTLAQAAGPEAQKRDEAAAGAEAAQTLLGMLDASAVDTPAEAALRAQTMRDLSMLLAVAALSGDTDALAAVVALNAALVATHPDIDLAEIDIFQALAAAYPGQPVLGEVLLTSVE